MRRWIKTYVLALVTPVCVSAMAAPRDVVVALAQIGGSEHGAVGTIRFADTRYGLLVTPDLHSLTPGAHGAHIHANASCAPAGMAGHTMPGGAAGDHLDPLRTGRHAGPYGDGHLGDLPNLYVEPDGTARIPVLAPRLKAAQLHGHALMIHLGADRYAGDAGPMMMGGMKMYCGVIR